MDKTKDLRQIHSLKKEIELLKKQIDGCWGRELTDPVTDSVTGSYPEFPYIEHVIKVTGMTDGGYIKKVSRLKKQLTRRLAELMDKVEAANEYIAGVDDSEVRMILQCRYINGMTWEQIEAELGINYRTAQRKFSNWQKNKKCR
ncbi:hypothetical protein DFR58_10198 [Anaerobacterium chartisolvens]|uniref:Uncharacterized protein n=1 Tax=Anaerobacterium chartisolvens TaxID=1297424 RepID=A0A369BJZ8_9FIRM|nr:RNA polymerase subunit sigma-24 [Anaerobacterium chartisolvens]RCX20896.1 hypothetical protein DFR58_10198 [Anaerobacterium chartisolvens]